MRSKWIRWVLLVVTLSLAAGTATPAAARPGEAAGLEASWWQVAAAWLADRLPFAGWMSAASEDEGTAPPEGDDSTPGYELLDQDGDRNESGNQNGNNNDSGPDADPDG